MSTYTVERRSALDTITIAFRWLVEHPALLVVFGIATFFDQLRDILVQDLSVDPGPGVLLSISLFGLAAALVGDGVGHIYGKKLTLNKEPQVRPILKTVHSRLSTLIGITILYLVSVIVGTVFFIVPGIYLALRLYLAFPACVIDDKGVVESFRISWDVADGNLLKLFGIGLVAFVPAILLLIAGLGVEVVTGPLPSSTTVSTLWWVVFPVVIVAVFNAVVALSTGRIYIENTQGDQAASPAFDPEDAPGAADTSGDEWRDESARRTGDSWNDQDGGRGADAADGWTDRSEDG